MNSLMSGTISWTDLLMSLIPALIGFLGVLAGSWVSIRAQRMQLNSDEQQRKQDFYINNTEELIFLIDVYKQQFSNEYVYLLPVMRGKYPYNTYLDNILEQKTPKEFNFSRLKFLLWITHHEQKTLFQEILELRSSIADSQKRHKKWYKENGLEVYPDTEEFAKLHIKISQLFDELEQNIATRTTELVIK